MLLQPDSKVFARVQVSHDQKKVTPSMVMFVEAAMMDLDCTVNESCHSSAPKDLVLRSATSEDEYQEV